jgi:hypothetical protein
VFARHSNANVSCLTFAEFVVGDNAGEGGPIAGIDS